MRKKKSLGFSMRLSCSARLYGIYQLKIEKDKRRIKKKYFQQL
jgi:hypothetical protein